ncbi:MAG: glycoside hydrolase family 3 N-terminal domain-containing protein [Nesterenkonia sp.]|nr:glycoside hydrolase family 3 N-terminal domain-containing protein [Nesterenkonia sp.]
MSLREKAGQVIVGEYSGTDASQMAQLIEDLHLGGAIVMGENVPTRDGQADLDALAAEIDAMQEAASDRGYPAVVSVDQEGGLVTRIGQPLTEWPTPMAYGAGAQGSSEDAGEEQARAGHAAMGADLAELGFTVDFAPNGDVTVGVEDPTIGTRSFGSDADSVTELSMAGLRGLAEAGVAGSMKHFPGHGSVDEDSHDTLPIQEKTLDQLWEEDWVPFREAAEEGAPMVMVGHLEVPALEDGVPSSLSSATYSQLRGLGFDGVVVTDALNMGAVVQQHGADGAPVQALAAGADLLLMPSDVRGAHESIVAAVDSGELEEERLDQAAERVVAMMLWQRDLAAGELAAGPGTGVDADAEEATDPPEDLSRRISGDAVTLVEGECEAELVDDGIQIVGGDETDRSRLSAAAEDAGVDVGDSGTVVRLLGGSRGEPGGDVAVALDRPEALADSDAETQIALYGRTEESFEVLLDVLEGGVAPGALPTPAGGYASGFSRCR